MKPAVAALLVICRIIFAICGSAFALTDVALKAVGDGFESRRDAMLASQVASPYPPGKPNALKVWGLQKGLINDF